jgi:hypothetical protein
VLFRSLFYFVLRTLMLYQFSTEPLKCNSYLLDNTFYSKLSVFRFLVTIGRRSSGNSEHT